MLSWVSDNIQRSQHQTPPAWYDNEIRFGLHNPRRRAATGTNSGSSKLPGSGLIPKLRRAFEAATHTASNSANGSFPVHEATMLHHELEEEETAFEACDSVSQTSESCVSHLSYNMSRIDEDDDATTNISINMHHDTMSFVNSMSSPCNSDVDSLFGRSLREMAQLDHATEKDRDDVWLLSTKNENEEAGNPGQALNSPTGSISRHVPVLVLPRFDHRRTMHSLQAGMAWGEDDEEEIDFDDDSFLIDDTASSPMGLGNDSDENRNTGNMMTRLTFGRKRANAIGKNLKNMMWNTTTGSSSNDYTKRGKSSNKSQAAKSSSKKKKKRKQPAARSQMLWHSKDPLKELSMCHEKMSGNLSPFSQNKSFNRIRDWNQDSSSASGMLQPLESRDSDDVPTPSSGILDSQLKSDLGSSSIESGGLSELTSTTAEPTASAFKIKFQSPKHDTPRIVLGEQTSDMDGFSEEPRILYSDDGTVEAIIHPKESEPQQRDVSISYPLGFFPSVDSSSLNHVFHSELSTLYEVSSSLESASFGTYSGSSGSSVGARTRNAAPGHGNQSILGTMSSSTSDSISRQTYNSKPQAHRKSKACYSPTSHFDGTADTRSNSTISGVTVPPFFADDCEVKMRWEYSLGVRHHSSEQWRQPVMGLMNTEEMSSDYIAEI